MSENPPRQAASLCVDIWQEPEDDVYTIVAINLPGAMSQGDSVEDAIINIQEAAEGIIDYCNDAGRPIPWKTIDPEQLDEPAGLRQWVPLHG